MEADCEVIFTRLRSWQRTEVKNKGKSIRGKR